MFPKCNLKKVACVYANRNGNCSTQMVMVNDGYCPLDILEN